MQLCCRRGSDDSRCMSSLSPHAFVEYSLPSSICNFKDPPAQKHTPTSTAHICQVVIIALLVKHQKGKCISNDLSGARTCLGIAVGPVRI